MWVCRLFFQETVLFVTADPTPEVRVQEDTTIDEDVQAEGKMT